MTGGKYSFQEWLDRREEEYRTAILLHDPKGMPTILLSDIKTNFLDVVKVLWLNALL